MDYLSLTLPEFERQYASEKDCIDAVFDARFPRGFVCPYCSHNDGYRLTTRRVVQCSSCRRQTSITAGTVFHRTRIPLVYWFKAIYSMSQDKGGVSALKFANQLGIRFETIANMLNKLRRAMSERDSKLLLAGHIEVDEAFFGGVLKDKEPGESSTSNKKQVLIMVEAAGERAGNLVMRVVDSGTSDDLKPVFEEKLDDNHHGNSFRTDGAQAHAALLAYGKLDMTPIPDELLDLELPKVSLVITHARRFLMGTYHHYCQRNLQLFLDEFCYRWNRRGSNREQWGQLSHRLIKACALYTPSVSDNFSIPRAHLAAFAA